MKDFVGYLVYRLAAGAFGLLPEPVMRRTGELLGWFGSFTSPAKFALVRRNLARVVGEDAATTARVRAMFSSYGRYWAETFWVRARRIESLIANSEIEHEERFVAAAAQGRGVILALPHLGNWEAAGAAANRIGLPVLAAAEALPNPHIVNWFIKVRGQLGIEVVLAGRDRSSTVRLVERLRNGGVIALVSDRDLAGRGVPVEFFGETTTLPGGPLALADRTGAVLLPVGCYFKRGKGHRFAVGHPIEIPDVPSRDERISLGTQRLAEELEKVVRRAPEQWHLFSPNWPSDRATAVDGDTEKVARS